MSGLVLVSPKNQFFDSSGNPLASGTVTTYLAGTTTLATTYQDRALLTANTNPITLNARGECSIWGSISSTYKYVVKDSTGATIYTEDNIPGTGSAADISAAVATALGDIEEAQDLADEAVALAQAAVAANGEEALNSLIDGEDSAIAILASNDEDYAMKVVDAANPANNRRAAITDIVSGIWTNPKIVTDSDGYTLKWSLHQLAKQTDAPTTAGNLSGATAAAVADIDGFLKAATLTASAGAEAAHKQLSLSASAYNSTYHMIEAVVKAGTSTFGYIGYNDGSDKLAYFNFSTWAAGTVAAGMTFATHTDLADGTALPSGYRRVTVYFQKGSGTINTLLGMCDADAAKTVTVGRTFTLEKFHLHLGVQEMEYVENTGTSAVILTPYDYSRGGRRILMEPAVTYDMLHSEDWTQADWVKTNCTAAYTSTGPAGALCSRITATASDATCLQAIVSASTSRMFSVYIKRITGTGTVEITTDNGGSWTDITSQLSTTKFKRFTLNGTSNPTCGVRVRTNADAIDVAFANSSATSVAFSPAPVGSTSLLRAANVPIIPVSLISTATNWTVYVDYDRPVGTGYPDDGNLRIGKADFSQEFKHSFTAANGQSFFSVDDGPTTKTYPIYKPASGERMEITVKLEATDHVMSVNGDPSAYIKHSVGMPTVEQLKIANSAPVFLRRLLMVPRAIDNDDVRTFRCSQLTRNDVLDCVTVAEDSDPDVPNISMNRAPSLCVLSDDGETADLLHFYCQKRSGSWHHTEAPMRIMQQKYRMTKSTGAITSLTAAAVIQQQSGWATGDGHLQSPAAIRIPSGTYEGRLVMTFTGLENPTFSPDKRSLYCMFNDADGDPTQWTTPTKIVAAASGQAYIGEPSGCLLILPPTHTYPNRIITMMTVIPGGAQSVYSDNYGQTWTLGTLFAPVGVGVDEMNIGLRPDGTLVGTYRRTVAPTTDRGWATSTDGGATWTDQGSISGYSVTAASAGLTQMDPTGLYGTYGKFALSHPASSVSRYGTEIHFFDDASMTVGDTYEPWPEASDSLRYFGYTSVKALFGGTHLALAVEGGSVPFNTDNTQYLAFIEAP
jgi:hypothetical protein